MIKFWRDDTDTIKSWGITHIIGVVNSKYVLSIRLFNYKIGWDKDFKRFI